MASSRRVAPPPPIGTPPAYTPEYPGYGVPASLLPDIAAGFMLALSLLGLGRAALSWRKAEKSGGDGQTAVRWRHLACFLIPCALLMPAMSLFGFLPAGIAFMVVIQIGCGQRRWFPMTLVSVAPVLLVYAIMRFGLGVPMP